MFKKIAYIVVSVTAHTIFLPVGVPSTLIFYGVNRPESCCPAHDLLLFEMVYFWPLLIPLGIIASPKIVSSMIQEYRQKKREKKREIQRRNMIPLIKAHHSRVGFQKDFPENAVETLLTDTLDFLQKNVRDDASHNWALRTVIEIERSKIDNLGEIVSDCEKAWDL